MNRLSHERRTQVIRALVEGNSIRATCRITGTAKGTVLRLLAEVGAVCAEYQDKHLRILPPLWIPPELYGIVLSRLFRLGLAERP